jgi:hypothetical protein
MGGAAKIEKNMIFWRKIVFFHTKYAVINITGTKFLYTQKHTYMMYIETEPPEYLIKILYNYMYT